MERIGVAPRERWQVRVEGRGFDFHTPVNPETRQAEAYWEEEAIYRLSEGQVNDLYDAAEALNDLCYEAVARVVYDEDLLRRFHIPQMWWDTVRRSWERGDKNLYGRMDFTLFDGELKLMEYNADTPTTLYEAGVAQWDRLEALALEGADQFNSLHEDIVRAWADPRRGLRDKTVYFACEKYAPEDKGTVDYLRDLAEQAGLATRFIYLDDIGLSTCGHYLTDLDDRVIEVLFKLYPWEMMAADDFGKAVPNLVCEFLEPIWKLVLSNKALLPLLWEMFPGHPNLLPAYFEDDPEASLLADYVRKPIFGREGANVTIVTPHQTVRHGGAYGAEGFIRQAYAPLPEIAAGEGKSVHAMFGVWIVGGVHDGSDDPERKGRDKPAGLTIREDDGPITTDDARFVPHYFLPDDPA